MPNSQTPVLVLDFGVVRVTDGATDRLNKDDVRNALSRHICGDWGHVEVEDWIENDSSLRNGYRVLSAYADRNSQKFWIVTEADRSTTTIMLPEEY